jgi:uncharacterized membrane protein
MSKSRLEAFSDGVLAIILTIMVLEMKSPQSPDFDALWKARALFLSYVLSFLYIGIYWNNHHHLFQVARSVDGRILWANLHLLFWLSLVPYLTGWLGQTEFAELPTAVYGFVLLMAGVAYYFLTKALVAHHGKDSAIAKGLGRDLKGMSSLLIYATAIGLAFVWAWVACVLYLVVALMWIVPDPRMVRVMRVET